ncbi:MAG: shikimate dehydrogenase [Planctomycetota bacterium]
MRTIDAKTKVCAVLGHPVGHSLSPEMHNAAFDALNLPFVYVAHDVMLGSVSAAMQGARAMGYRGLSITIPHKVTALECADEVDETARVIGCINTIVNDNGRLLGSNSDGLGALAALREAGADPEGSRTLVLGSGGAARAIAVTVSRKAPPERISLLGIEDQEVELLARDLKEKGQADVTAGKLTDDALRAELEVADILLHCSPIGMHPHEDQSLVPAELLGEGLAVFDAVYNPRRTKLIRDAENAGCKTVLGLEMFLGQAFAQFELWTGEDAPRRVMREVVERRL